MASINMFTMHCTVKCHARVLYEWWTRMYKTWIIMKTGINGEVDSIFNFDF